MTCGLRIDRHAGFVALQPGTRRCAVQPGATGDQIISTRSVQMCTRTQMTMALAMLIITIPAVHAECPATVVATVDGWHDAPTLIRAAAGKGKLASIETAQDVNKLWKGATALHFVRLSHHQEIRCDRCSCTKVPDVIEWTSPGVSH